MGVGKMALTRRKSTAQWRVSILERELKDWSFGDVVSGYAISIYRKPTHTDRYLHFESHHPTHVKRGVVRCCHDRAREIISMQDNLHKEVSHLARVRWLTSLVTFVCTFTLMTTGTFISRSLLLKWTFMLVSVNDKSLYTSQVLIMQLYTRASRTEGWLLRCMLAVYTLVD